MKVLIDTHVLILREFGKSVPRRVQDFFKLLNNLSVNVVLHPLARQSIEQDKNVIDGKVLLSKLDVYPILEDSPNPNDDDKFLKYFGKAATLEESVDQNLLFCIYKNKAAILITEDPTIHENASRIGISNKVLSLKEALLFFQDYRQYQALKNKSDREQIYFCKTGEQWRIGIIGKELLFRDSKGFQFIHFLLSRPGEEFSPLVVYKLGVDGDKDNSSESDKKDLAIWGENLGPLIDPKGVKFILKHLDAKKKELEKFEMGNPEIRLEKKSEILLIEKVLKDSNLKKKIQDPDFEKARVNITKHIKKALDRIKKETPDLEMHLNDRTIKTGSKMSYNVPLNNPPEWIL